MTNPANKSLQKNAICEFNKTKIRKTKKKHIVLLHNNEDNADYGITGQEWSYSLYNQSMRTNLSLFALKNGTTTPNRLFSNYQPIISAKDISLPPELTRQVLSTLDNYRHRFEGRIVSYYYKTTVYLTVRQHLPTNADLLIKKQLDPPSACQNDLLLLHVLLQHVQRSSISYTQFNVPRLCMP